MSHSHGAEADEETHHTSWSANLERAEHEASRERVVADAREAVRRTASGYHVNLVTHGAHGHPEAYLYDALDAEFGDGITHEYVERCGCGGHVVRVHVD